MNEMLIGNDEGEIIQFLHANAYTPGCYREMFNHVKGYGIFLPEQRPLWKDADATKFSSWNMLADDIISHMDNVGRKSVIGIGHSMGGVASWVAAVKRPDLFSRLILIDPVILPINYFRTMSFLPYWVKKKFVPIIKIAANRTNRWKDREEAKKYLLSKSVFKRFHSKVLEDFLDYGMSANANELILRFPREWESRVYASPPNLWKMMNKKTCPITIIRAEFSDVINDERWVKIQNRLANGRFIQLDGARHLVPFEEPERCAKVLLEILSSDEYA